MDARKRQGGSGSIASISRNVDNLNVAEYRSPNLNSKSSSSPSYSKYNTPTLVLSPAHSTRFHTLKNGSTPIPSTLSSPSLPYYTPRTSPAPIQTQENFQPNSLFGRLRSQTKRLYNSVIGEDAENIEPQQRKNPRHN